MLWKWKICGFSYFSTLVERKLFSECQISMMGRLMSVFFISGEMFLRFPKAAACQLGRIPCFIHFEPFRFHCFIFRRQMSISNLNLKCSSFQFYFKSLEDALLFFWHTNGCVRMRKTTRWDHISLVFNVWQYLTGCWRLNGGKRDESGKHDMHLMLSGSGYHLWRRAKL
jgi:hypothetical protein